ncbi:T9SS type A sorting domain-containing protein [Mariniphaga sp.]|uniref:T9SS type A sorting domain-containing protein n=1 Tax=Mariniphaga sp. TaxID=1954475 RepID=UPI00356625EC
MKNIIKHFSILFFILCIQLNTLAQENKNYGTSEKDFAHSLTKFKEHFYIVGTTRKTNTSPTDYYVLQLNENGGLRNEFIFGEIHSDNGNDIIVDDDGIFVLGKTWTGGYPNNDMLLSKLDFNGNRLWKKYYGGERNDLGHKFIKTRNGDFVLVGFNRTVDDFGDVYIVRTDKNGEIIWENHFGERYIDHGFSVVENEAGELVIAGTKGGFYNPTSTDYLNPDAEIYIIKTDAQGQEIWQKTYGGTSHDWAKDIIQAPGGGYFVCGSTQSEGTGSFDMFLMKIDEDGNQLWLKTYGGQDWEYGETVQKSEDNHLYLLATSASYSGNYKPEHLLIKTDLEGEIIWSNIFGSENSDYSSALVCTADSGCAFTGWSNPGTIGKEDIVFYKISKNGEAQILSCFNPVNDSIEQIQIFPNPAKDSFSVIIETKVSSGFELKLFDLNGKMVYENTIEPNVLKRFSGNLPPGAYILQIQNNRFKYSSKLVFQ